MPEIKVKKEVKKKDYKYEERAEMPFWFHDQAEKLHLELDEDSLLSIDAAYDPEKNIELKYFEEISRIVEYKDIMMRYFKKSSYNFADKKAKLDAMKEMLKTVTLLRASMIELDKFLQENLPIVMFMQKFFI